MSDFLLATGRPNGCPNVQRVSAAATTNATSVKASAGVTYGWSLYNKAAAAVYVKFYDKASAPTVGTDTPLFILGIPAGARVDIRNDLGIPFANGIAYGITTGVADSDVTAPVANDVTGVILWK